MPILITNIKNALLKDALMKTQPKKVVFIHEDMITEDQFKSLVSDLNFQIEYLHVPLDDLKTASFKLNEILSNSFKESSDVYFALEPDAMGLQILEAAKEFNIKKFYMVQAGKLNEFKACFIKGF